MRNECNSQVHNFLSLMQTNIQNTINDILGLPIRTPKTLLPI